MADNVIDDVSSNPPVPQPIEVLGAQDWFLQFIIENFIAHGVEIGITVTVGGACISGTLISGRKYFEQMADMTLKASKSADDVSAIMAKSCRELTEIYDKPAGSDENWMPPPAGFIHLKGAKYFHPGKESIPDGDGMLWRGKLSSIGGFSIGKFQRS